jgi:hypothetical protein
MKATYQERDRASLKNRKEKTSAPEAASSVQGNLVQGRKKERV